MSPVETVQIQRDEVRDHLITARAHMGALLSAIESGDAIRMRIAAEMVRAELAVSAPHLLRTVAQLRKPS